ncbi:MAG TPA: hypothetical protein VMT18_05845 [Planctomycetota bacterium]|nr:hypothetical protein [Planctomycetota bacterium]
MRTVAQRLFAHEAKGLRRSASSVPTVLRVCERLRPELASLVGDTGVQALYMRALALAGAQVDWLRAIRVGADGRLEGFEGAETPVEPDEVSAGGVALLAELLALLAAFVGVPLTLRIVREQWPRLALKDLDRNKRN